MIEPVEQSDRGDRLRGWKEIGRWFGVDERTVKRWETSRKLPVHRLPGEARAPVYAFTDELGRWIAAQEPGLQSSEAAIVPTGASPPPGESRSIKQWRIGLVAAAVAVAGAAGFAGLHKATSDPSSLRTDHIRGLTGDRLAELNARLEHQPRTVRLRAALAQDAADTLRDIADEPGAAPELRRDAAALYRRLSIIQSATDRPSLLDRKAARTSLASALQLVSSDQSATGRILRAQLLVDASRQAAGDGKPDEAQALLDRAVETVPEQIMPPALHDDWRLTGSEIAQWRGDYKTAIAHAATVLSASIDRLTADRALSHIRALDLIAEAEFYDGNTSAALNHYRQAQQFAVLGRRQWPDDIRWRWYLGREGWNVGSTLADMNRGKEAVDILSRSLNDWERLNLDDPEDESIAYYVRATRLSYGGALMIAGRPAEAARVLAVAVGEARGWLSRSPGAYDRQRAMVTRLGALGDALAAAGKPEPACAAYGEASSYVRTINAAGKLNKLDRDSMIRILRQGTTRSCPTLRI